jgi:NADPH:quinone reductase-like Zn-dependent oxidoreductase
MKAVVYTEYGLADVLQLKDVERPVPQDNEVLVKVHAASVNAADWHLLRGKPFLVRLMGFGLLRPKHAILGMDVAGRVEAVGGNAKQFRPGDEVFGSTRGGFAEYTCAPEDGLASKPASMTFDEVAAVPTAGLTALQGLRDKGGIRPGQKVLIHGASGGVGTFAVQIAKSFGTEVTGVCSARHADSVRSLGADHVIDYAREDFAGSGERYDLILAVAGSRSVFDYRRALAPGGVCVIVGGSPGQVFPGLLLGPWLSMTGGKKVTGMLTQVSLKDLAFLLGLLEAGRVRPVIDRRYPLSQVPDAIRYLGDGHAGGKVVVTPEPSHST